MYFGGGETVYTADETRRMLNGAQKEMQIISFLPLMQNYLEATRSYNAIQYNEPLKVHSTPRENAPVNISVNFQIEGNATQETVDALSNIGESLRQIIREEMEEVASDNRRIAYI